MTLDADRVSALLDATWPPASLSGAGGFCIREGRGGGSRVSCATLQTPGAKADLDAAIRAQIAFGQRPVFMIRAGEDALDAELEARGFVLYDPVLLYQAPTATLARRAEPMSAFAHWPPLAITREIWTASGTGPARQAIIERAAHPKAAILGRVEDRAAGAAFVAIDHGAAMLHALTTLPAFRRKGLGRAMMAEAARWADAAGAERLYLAVTQANGPANALYADLGMTVAGRYHYRRAAG